MSDWKKKIKRKALGEAPIEASPNIQAPEPAPAPTRAPVDSAVPEKKEKNLSRLEQLEKEVEELRDKRLTGRTKQLGLKVKAEFHRRVKQLASEEGCYVVEILEKALECYERERKKEE